jgi:glycosyltransferase involved in cell wall biosynthesis
MRRLIVTSSYPRNAGDPSGHFVQAEARKLAATGQQVVVLAAGGDRREPAQRLTTPHGDGDLTVAWLGAPEVFGWPGAADRLRSAPARGLQLLGLPGSLRRRLRELGPFDRITAHWLVPCAFPLLLACGDIPSDAMAHGADVRLLVSLPHAARHGVTAWLLQRLEHIRFASHDGRERLVDALPASLAARLRRNSFVKPARIELEPAALDDESLTRRFGLSPGRDYLTTAGRLVSNKRVDLAIDATARAGATLVVIGDGPERAALEQRARSQALDARFVGRVPRADALGLIARSAALVHTSAHEAAPTVVREARALGVPVVACPSGDLKAWAADDAHLTIVDANPARLARAIESLVSAAPPTEIS